MLRMYLLQVWFSLSDEGVEEAIYDSYAMRRFMRLDFSAEQVPDATTLLHFRHLLEERELGERLLAAQQEIFEREGWIMRGGSIVDATIIAAPSSTKNQTGTRDPEMHQTKKGNQWHFGMKAHIGVDAGTGYVHSVSTTAANVHDLDQVTGLVRHDDQVVYADAGYQGVGKRPEVIDDPHLCTVQWRVAARKGALKEMHEHDRAGGVPQSGSPCEGRASVSDRQTRLRVLQDPLPRDQQEPAPPPDAVRLRQLADAWPCGRPRGGSQLSVSLPETRPTG